MVCRHILEKSLAERYSCKEFDKEKKIAKEDIKLLAKTFLYAPNALGLESARYIFISNEEVKRSIATLTYAQQQIIDCSHLVILMNEKPENINPQSVKNYYQLLNFPQNQIEDNLQMLESILDYRLQKQPKLIEGFAREQVYLAMGDMLRVATLRGINSLIVGEFNEKEIYKFLDKLPNTHTERFFPCVLIALGYGLKEATPKVRLPLGEIVSFLE